MFSALLSIAGIIVAALSISPPSDIYDKDDNWFVQQFKWIKTFDNNKDTTYPVKIKPRRLWLGVVLAIAGIIWGSVSEYWVKGFY
jgi:hypothetical protein